MSSSKSGKKIKKDQISPCEKRKDMLKTKKGSSIYLSLKYETI